MIVVTTLKGEQLAINDELIERVEDGNETRIVLTSGACYIVAESIDEVVRRCRWHRAEVEAQARRLIAYGTGEGVDHEASHDGEHADLRVLPLGRPQHGGHAG